FWVQDCSAATENILLAAVALGLGTVWLGVHPIHNFKKRISAILGLPKNVDPLNIIYVGYPAEEKKPRTQYDPKRVHWEKYSS
ncbi:MAG: nitroreductase family protein, partial [Chloroflexota bacterium]|nr:nitroreductase family protein [Chloroflexota bacterium]